MSSKHRTLKSITLIILLLFMTLIPAFAVSAGTNSNYLALGDSIAYGLTAQKIDGVYNGYANRFAASLGSSYNYKNDAWPGLRTGDVLAYVNANSGSMPIQTTKILTFSIGSNNLLGPTIAAIAALYRIDATDPIYNDPNDPEGNVLKAELASRITAEMLAGGNAMDTLGQLLQPLSPAGAAYNQALLKGTAEFTKEWPAIIARVRKLNSFNEIYVNTVYNPLRVTGSSDPLYPLYLKMETLMGIMNTTIKAYAVTYHYRVVDVYKGFKSYPAASSAVLTFSITTALQALSVGNMDLFKSSIDPHPTDFGQQKIYEWLRSVRSSTPYWYWRLPIFG